MSKDVLNLDVLNAVISEYLRQQGCMKPGDAAILAKIYRKVMRAKADDEVLYDSGGVKITTAEVMDAIKTAKKRLGTEAAQMLEGNPYEGKNA